MLLLRREIITAIDIAAPVERVWRVLMDWPAYSGWNPFIRLVDGNAQEGETISVLIAPAGQKGMRFRPVLVKVQKNRALRWRGKVLVPGLFDGEHAFELQPDTDGTRFSHTERFSGLLVPIVMRGEMLRATQAGFEAMNAALKERCEQPVRLTSETMA